MEARLVLLPAKAGNIGGLMTFKGKLVYYRLPNTGSGERSADDVAVYGSRFDQASIAIGKTGGVCHDEHRTPRRGSLGQTRALDDHVVGLAFP